LDAFSFALKSEYRAVSSSPDYSVLAFEVKNLLRFCSITLSYDLGGGVLILDNRKLVLIWEDILMEHGGEETVNAFIKEYSNYSIEDLLKIAFLYLELETENHPCRYKIEIGDYLHRDEYTIIYESNEINYHELLVALVVLMMLINFEQRPELIIKLAHALRIMDREISHQFAKDIAEEVYWQYK